MPLLPPRDLSDGVRSLFGTTFGGEAAHGARAPGRVNLIGEHTDYNAGTCLPIALPHATYVAVSPRPDRKIRAISTHETSLWEGENLQQAKGWAAYVAGVVWALRATGMDLPGFDIAIASSVPLGAGLSSSAALECAVALAVTAGAADDESTRRRLISACIRAETEIAGAPTGGMDQTVALLATPGAALLIDFRDHTTTQIPIDTTDLAVLVIDTRVKHALVDGGYAARRADCETAAAAIGVPNLRLASLDDLSALTDTRIRRRARHVVTEIQRVELATDALRHLDWVQLGALFDASHVSMRDDFEISCPELDAAVETAKRCGALGARMTGGGFGGSAIALVDREAVGEVIEAISTEFQRRDYAPPDFLLAEPSGPGAII